MAGHRPLLIENGRLGVFSYPVTSSTSTVFPCLEGPRIPSVWAVGRAGIDEQGNRGDRSHGAVYKLDWPADEWKQVRLDGVQFSPGQALSDILQLDDQTILVAGEKRDDSSRNPAKTVTNGLGRRSRLKQMKHFCP